MLVDYFFALTRVLLFLLFDCIHLIRVGIIIPQERVMAQWLERGDLPMSLPAVRL